MPPTTKVAGHPARDDAAFRTIQSVDWASTALGAMDRWPVSLVTALRIMLRAREPMLLWWGDDLVQFCNDASIGLPGHPRNFAIGQQASTCWSEAWTILGPQVVQVMASGSSLLVEDVPVTGPGEVAGQEGNRRFELSSVFGDMGTPMGVLVTLPDSTPGSVEMRRLSERVEKAQDALEAAMQTNAQLAQANAALERAARFMRTITDNIPGRVAYWDAEMRCLFANRSFAQWFGKTPQEMQGRSPMDMFGPRVLDAVRPYVDAALAGDPQIFESPAQQPDGSIFFHQVHYLPDAPVDGVRPGIFVMGFDITALKRAQAALKTANDDLAIARDDAQAANRAKSAFLANMSHEIRTPLNAVIGLTHLLSRDAPSESQRERLAKVHGAAQHLLGLIDAILDLSKIEEGKLQLDKTDFSSSSMLGRVSDMVGQRLAEKGLDFRLDTDGLPQWLRGDALRLSQILINFLSNAAKFTEQGWVRLHARLVQETGTQVCLRFEVQDTGPGIAPEHQLLLFTPFTQADGTISRRHGGTGLGLALSRQLARAMGGEAGVVSAPGEGSTFWAVVWLERGSSSAAHAMPRFSAGAADTGVGANSVPLLVEAAHSAAEAKLREDHTGQRILLAEDNPINREVAQLLLGAAGLAVDTAENGAVAVEMSLAGQYDLILMDMQMPVMDGLQATRVIRARSASKMPIIAMTANAFAEDRQACLDAGMNDHVAKPFQPELLYELLLRWLPGGHLAR